MEDIKQYLLTIFTAAVLCGIVNGIIGKNGAYGSIVKLISSLVLVLSVISPWAKIKLTDFTQYTDIFINEAEQITMNGKTTATLQNTSIIKSKTESYILDKAAELGLNLEVNILLCKAPPHTPYAVEISGNASPYQKKRLKMIITDDLGILEENQTWI